MAKRAYKGADCKTLRPYWSAGIDNGRLSKPQGLPPSYEALLIRLTVQQNKIVQVVSGCWTAARKWRDEAEPTVLGFSTLVNISLHVGAVKTIKSQRSLHEKTREALRKYPQSLCSSLHWIVAVSGNLSQVLIGISAHPQTWSSLQGLAWVELSKNIIQTQTVGFGAGGGTHITKVIREDLLNEATVESRQE